MDRENSNYRGKQKNWVLLNHILDGHLNSLTEFNLNFHLQRQSKQDPNPIVLYHHHIRCMKSLRNTYLKKMSNPDEEEREGGRAVLLPALTSYTYWERQMYLVRTSIRSEETRQMYLGFQRVVTVAHLSKCNLASNPNMGNRNKSSFVSLLRRLSQL